MPAITNQEIDNIALLGEQFMRNAEDKGLSPSERTESLNGIFSNLIEAANQTDFSAEGGQNLLSQLKTIFVNIEKVAENIGNDELAQEIAEVALCYDAV